MATELETQKLFASYFQEEGLDTPTVEGTADGSTVASATNSPAAPISAEVPTDWSGALIALAAVFTIFGLSGVFGGLWDIKNLADAEAFEMVVSRIKHLPQELKVQVGIMAASVKYSPYMYALLGLRILVGLTCFGAATVLSNRTENANNIAILVCFLCIFYNLFLLAMTYVTSSELSNVKGLDPALAENAVMISMVVASGFFLLKMAIYCGLAYFLSRPAMNQLFLPKSKRPEKMSFN